jgi:hypothetical protein
MRCRGFRRVSGMKNRGCCKEKGMWFDKLTTNGIYRNCIPKSVRPELVEGRFINYSFNVVVVFKELGV